MALGFHMGGFGEMPNPFDGVVYDSGVWNDRFLPVTKTESGSCSYVETASELQITASGAYGVNSDIQIITGASVDVSDFSVLRVYGSVTGFRSYARPYRLTVYDEQMNTLASVICTDSSQSSLSGYLEISVSSYNQKVFIGVGSSIGGFGPGGSGSYVTHVTKIELTE